MELNRVQERLAVARRAVQCVRFRRSFKCNRSPTLCAMRLFNDSNIRLKQPGKRRNTFFASLKRSKRPRHDR